MARNWQKIDAQCHSCHSWPEFNERMITAMTEILIIALALAATATLLRVVWWALIDDDGYHRPERTRTAPRSHFPDPFDPTQAPTRLA